ncbi:hypothetical protein PR003_g24893 [Phytophthora rubi]|uniref:Uncharacterized protein n=2 Tax=Phytophthora TaxID=4783 RepID=A0A6A4CIL3_9STRA|nr:hypothetical protein PR003_g24893 [Phytophthora rubi]
MASCNWKSCRQVDKISSEDPLLVTCDNGSCSQAVHHACLISMLAAFGAEDPFQKQICGKRCYNTVMKAQRQVMTPHTPKKRIPWHNDVPNNSVSSLSVLIKWMTDGNNYNRYRGGEGQNGETKQTLVGEVSSAIGDSGVMTARTPNDVMSKNISAGGHLSWDV